MTQIPPILVDSEGIGVRAGPFSPLDGRPVVTGVRNGAEGINVATFFLMRGPLCRTPPPSLACVVVSLIAPLGEETPLLGRNNPL